MRRILEAVSVLLLAGLVAASPAYAKRHWAENAEDNGPDWKGTTETAHTIAWWCVDLNELWHVEVPVVIGAGVAFPPDPSPIPDPCSTSFPVTVPSGSRFVPSGGAIWVTNRTYPPAVRAALESIGYEFHSQSPAEDFMSKLDQILVEVRTSADRALVAEFFFDPRQNFRLVQYREFNGQVPIAPTIIPELGIDISGTSSGACPRLASR